MSDAARDTPPSFPRPRAVSSPGFRAPEKPSSEECLHAFIHSARCDTHAAVRTAAAARSLRLEAVCATRDSRKRQSEQNLRAVSLEPPPDHD